MNTGSTWFPAFDSMLAKVEELRRLAGGLEPLCPVALLNTPNVIHSRVEDIFVLVIFFFFS